MDARVVIQKNHTTMIKIIANNDPLDVADVLYQANLMDQAKYDEICKEPDSTKNARAITSAIRMKVEQDSENLVKLIDTIRTLSPDLTSLADTLSQSLETLKNERTSSCSSLESFTHQSSLDSSSSSIEFPDFLGDFDKSRNAELNRWNENKIRSKFSSLRLKIAKKMKEVSPEDVCSFIQSFPNCENVETLLKGSKSVDEIFTRLLRDKYWHFYDISPLHSIVEEFIVDNDEIIEEIDAYEERLTGYKAITKICEKIKWDSLRTDDESHENAEKTPISCTPYNRKKLVITLMNARDLNVTDYTIKYLEEVFKRFQKRFNHSLDAVLHKVTGGSATVTWYISSLSAQNTLDYLHESVEFLKSINVSTIFLEHCLIYSDSIGAINSKELDEVRLLLAVQDRSTERVSTLIEGITGDINQITQVDDPTLLMRAANGGSVDILRILINHGAKVNEQDIYGWSALSYASVAGHTAAVDYLLEQGADITLQSKSTKFPNVLALLRDNKKDVHDLLKDHLNQNMINDAKDGKADFVRAALRTGADVEALDKKQKGWVALAWASNLGHLEVVDVLLCSNANPNVQCGKFKWSPIILSSRNGHVEILKRLLHRGANVEQATSDGWTSLRYAAAHGRVEVGKVLIDAKADVYSMDDEDGYTPLSQAAQDGKADFVSMLIQKVPTIDLNQSSEKGEGWTPLMLASKNGHTDVVDLLLREGADVNHQNGNKMAAIHAASFANHYEVVKLLINYDADVNVADEWGVTSLMFAAKQGHVGVVKALKLNKNLDFNLQEKDAKFSAAFFAIQCKKLDVLDELMMSKKVDCTKTDLHGKTLWKLIETTDFEGAKELFEKNYPEEMNQMIAIVPQTSSVSQATAAEEPPPTGKSKVDDSKSPDLYIKNMLEGIDTRFKEVKPRAAEAA